MPADRLKTRSDHFRSSEGWVMRAEPLYCRCNGKQMFSAAGPRVAAHKLRFHELYFWRLRILS